MQTTNGSETGSNAGSDFYLTAYADNGAYLANVLGITRSNQAVTFYGGVTFSSGSFYNAYCSAISINSSAVNSTPVGNSSPSTGAFTTLGSSGTLTASSGSSNYLTFTGGASGTGPSIVVNATTDTNVSLNINTVGTGALVFNDTQNNQARILLDNGGAHGFGITFGTMVTFGSAFSWRTGMFSTVLATLDGSGNYTATSIQNTPIGSTTASTGAFTTLSGSGTASTIAAGTGAGTSSTVAVTGHASAGKISVTTGTSPTASAVIATVTLGQTYNAAPYVTFSPGNAATAALSGNSSVYGTSTTTTFVLNAGSTALAASTAYVWFYNTIG